MFCQDLKKNITGVGKTRLCIHDIEAEILTGVTSVAVTV